jgi:hypothetical protein
VNVPTDVTKERCMSAAWCEAVKLSKLSVVAVPRPARKAASAALAAASPSGLLIESVVAFAASGPVDRTMATASAATATWKNFLLIFPNINISS